MPDIKIKGWSGTDFQYQAVPKIWIESAQSTEEAPVLVPYTYGEAVSKTVEPDFSAGDMAVDIQDGELVKELTITKPETLIPENIAAGVTVAGVLGSFTGGGNCEITTIIPRQVLTFSNSGENGIYRSSISLGTELIFELEDNVIYLVEWDGTLYPCRKRTMVFTSETPSQFPQVVTLVCIGNPLLEKQSKFFLSISDYTGEAPDTGDPFAMSAEYSEPIIDDDGSIIIDGDNYCFFKTKSVSTEHSVGVYELRNILLP